MTELPTTIPHLVFIHGANQSSSCWSHIIAHLQPHSYTHFDYDSRNSFACNLEQMKNEMSHLKEVFFVAHSLGGLYGVHLYHHFKNKVKGAVTISTPYGGSALAFFFRQMFPSYALFSDICPSSPPIYSSNLIHLDVPWTQIVTTRGHHPIHILPNDGVVTKHSMMCRSDIDYVLIDEDHYDVLYSNDVVEIIKNHLTNIPNHNMFNS